MSIREAIKKMKCKERKCKYLDEKGVYTFCRALFSDNFCGRKDKMEKNDE